MDSSKPEANVGKMWVVVASGVSIGIFRLSVCVDVMVVFLEGVLGFQLDRF